MAEKTQAEVDLETKQLDTRAEKIKLKEKELEEKEKELNEKEKKLESVEQKLAQCVKDFELQVKKLASFCQQGKVNHQLGDKSVPSQSYAIATHPSSTDNILSGFITADMLRELVKNKPLRESEDLFNALQCTQDPAKLVLDTSMTLCPTTPEGSYEFKLLITSDSCCLLLNQLKKLMPQIGNTVKEDAKKLAVYWKDKFSQSKQCNLEVICFLEFLGIYGIVSEFKADDLIGLLRGVN